MWHMILKSLYEYNKTQCANSYTYSTNFTVICSGKIVFTEHLDSQWKFEQFSFFTHSIALCIIVLILNVWVFSVKLSKNSETISPINKYGAPTQHAKYIQRRFVSLLRVYWFGSVAVARFAQYMHFQIKKQKRRNIKQLTSVLSIRFCSAVYVNANSNQDQKKQNEEKFMCVKRGR